MEANRERAKVHMLPTNGKDISMLSKRVKDGMLQSANGTEGVANCNTMWQPQHLYFTTDEEIKEGDWTISKNNELSQAFGYLGRCKEEGYRKIIATTNSNIKMFTGIENLDTAPSYPQPSQATIKAYCEQGGFDEVDVEYEINPILDLEILDGKTRVKETIFIPKVDPEHNTITTHRIVEKMYSLDEMKKMWIHLGEQGWGDSSGEGFDKWIKENLKQQRYGNYFYNGK